MFSLPVFKRSFVGVSARCLLPLVALVALLPSAALAQTAHLASAAATFGNTETLLKSADFSTVQVGSRSPAVPLTFSFDTGGTIQAPAVLTLGAANLDFTDAGTGTCTTNGVNYSYNPGDSCTVNVLFSPKVAGARSGAVVLRNSTGNLIASAPLNGTGLAPQVVFSPSAIATLGGGFASPRGATLDASGNVYVADYSNSAVKEIPDGCTSSDCVTALGGQFGAPGGVAVDGSGNVYVADSSNSAVVEIPAGCTASAYSSASCTTTTLGGGFSSPEGVAVDGSGSIYVADTGNNAVKTMPAGCASPSCVVTLGGGFNSPSGV